jgi:plastocyanin
MYGQNIFIMKKKFIYITLFILAAAIVIYSCSKSNNSKPPNTFSGASVSIQNFAFMPDTIRITAGSTVKWTNMDGMPHTATSLTSVFNSGSISPGSAFQFTFATAGTFTYHCTIHDAMKAGVVIVTN